MSFITNKTLVAAHVPARRGRDGRAAAARVRWCRRSTPSRARRQLSPTRFTGIFIPHGAAPGYWVPKSSANFEFPYIYKPLETVPRSARDHERHVVEVVRESAGRHGRRPLRRVRVSVRREAEEDHGRRHRGGTTLDQAIAQQIGQDTLMPSLQLAVEDPGANASNCGEGYSCVYTNTISWQTPNRPLPMQINPQVVFEQLFGDGGTPPSRARAARKQRSILDSRAGDPRERSSARSASSDRARLEQYLEDVREIERRLQIAAKASTEAPAIAMPYGVPDSFDEHIKLQFDLLALAYQARHHARRDAALRARSHGPRVSRERHPHQLPRRLAPRRGPGPHREFAKLNQYHVQDARVLHGKAALDPRRRRHAARPLAHAVRLEHG